MNQVQRAKPLLGTIVQILARADCDTQQLHRMVGLAFSEIELVHRLMSPHDPSSELSRVNREAAATVQPIHVHFHAVLAASLEFARHSDGAFDPTVGQQLTSWGLLPQHGDAQYADVAGSWHDIDLSSSGVRFRRQLCLDLGGIAKGYAVDLAVRRLQQCGASSIVVNAGGDLRVTGILPETIAIRHPRLAHARGHELVLNDEALASSSIFESIRDVAGRKVSALVEPRSGGPFLGTDSVSVRAPTCMAADALTKVALFAPAELAERLLALHQASCIRLYEKHSA